MADLETGQRLGAYRLEERLGEGGMGVVFRAVHEPEGDEVALKVLRAELSADETFRQRFVHEARAAGEVRHKHLVPITDAGEAEGRPYLAVAFVRGQTLEARLASVRPLPLPDMVRVVAHVASGLDALHAGGIVHRDVKPSNVMIDETGSASLTDFGLAKGRAYTVLTKPGMVMGTLDYLAPEMLRGSEATGASDIYALGCLAYECTAGRAPFADKSMFDLASAHLNAEPPDPCANRPDAPEGLSWAILQALAKDPEKRPPTATAYAHLISFAAGTRDRVAFRPAAAAAGPTTAALAGAASRLGIGGRRSSPLDRLRNHASLPSTCSMRSRSPTRSASRRSRSHSCSARPSASTVTACSAARSRYASPLSVSSLR